MTNLYVNPTMDLLHAALAEHALDKGTPLKKRAVRVGEWS